MKSSRLRSLSYLLAILLVALVMPLNAQASVNAGAACKVAGSSQKISGKIYTCSLVNKKLVWRIKPATVPKIFVGLTWAQIATEKDAAAAKIAEEERLNQEAVARALAEA